MEAGELAEIAARLRVVFDAITTGDIDAAASQVNDLLEETRARPMLERHDGEPWHLHFHGPGGTVAGDWAASCATGLAIVLGSEYSRPSRRVYGAALRPGLRGRLPQRHPEVLRHRLPEPRQDRGLPFQGEGPVSARLPLQGQGPVSARATGAR